MIKVNCFVPVSISLIFYFFSLDADELFGQTVYISDDGLITYTVPPGFKLTDIPVEYHDIIDPDYKMAYKESNSGVNPSILLNFTVVSSEVLQDASFIYLQRDLLGAIHSNADIENFTSLASDNHPNILNAVYLVESNGVHFFNSIYYFFYELSRNETIMWTMTCTYSFQERDIYSNIFLNAAKSFVFNY